MTTFKNLFTAISAEENSRLQSFINNVNKATSTQDLSGWIYTDLLPAGKKNKVWELNELKAYLIARKTKATEKQIAKELAHLQAVEKAPDFTSFKINMEWKKNRTWGANPTAEGWATDGYFKSGSIGGCGYDKGSTAVADVLNQSNSLLKLLYTAKEQNPNAVNREFFGYGSGYGILPRIEGGVGVSCYPAIFEKLGFAFKTTASGKMFDAYSIEKL